MVESEELRNKVAAIRDKAEAFVETLSVTVRSLSGI